ncbi:hypothetical protein FZ041_06595 [Selenomonas caprae]|uniref:Uncharacterized protein n=1 Tax=Selenomonas caprae TaxID=2606905 RepID=A0A5D6WK58_9FIRM|nr:hypothetical protein [Selenomonas caprae]TYZ28971.1 hypothetical protein FZ041_06595 [Selenomonas caprae]
MTNYDMLLQINKVANTNIKCSRDNDEFYEIDKCLSFSSDLQNWISYCGDLGDMILVQEAQNECIKSIYFCTEGFYKEAIIALRQYFEHLLFAIYLSTSDFNYRLWKKGKYDMSWKHITDKDSGIFSVKFIELYADDISSDISMELLNDCSGIYRECSEFVHGNYEKLDMLCEKLVYNQESFQLYIKCFSRVKYIICMALFIRFRSILDDANAVEELEMVIRDNIGTRKEVQKYLKGRE